MVIRAYKLPDVLELIQQHEGLRLKPYKDTVGVWTIGIGRNLEKGITEQEARDLAYNDIIACEKDLDRALPWWRNMSKRRQIALLDMCFNLGLPRLLTFKRALAAMEAEDWDTAKREMLDSRWATQVGARADTIADMMKEG